MAGVQDTTVVLADANFHRAAGDPPNLKVYPRGEWNQRMLVETVLSMLTLVCHFKNVMHRVWDDFCARLAYTMAAFNLLVQWDGLQPDEEGFIPLSSLDRRIQLVTGLAPKVTTARSERHRDDDATRPDDGAHKT
ncbi:MAG: hypothetical protein HY332_22165 [Chloroflexi bacterium]|nr:hypothetical protein [Chloroflexota bacterium]